MKVTTVLGTRPEIIRLSKVIPLLDTILGEDNHFLFYTGQNSNEVLCDIFFKEFDLRPPDLKLNQLGSEFSTQVANMFPIFEGHLRDYKPDRVLILGDTNSSLLAIVAARMGVPVYHVEAGNRTYGPRFPEEVNRRIIDHVSDVHLCYDERSRANLLREGIPIQRTFVVGNPIHEKLASLPRHNRVGRDPFLLMTIHRQEHTDDRDYMRWLCGYMSKLMKETDYKIGTCLHPRTIDRLREYGMIMPGNHLGSIGWRQFIDLMLQADCVITDSGTVEEECAFLGVACVVARKAQERHSEMERGGVILDEEIRLESIKAAIATCAGSAVPHYTESVAGSIVGILLGENHKY